MSLTSDSIGDIEKKLKLKDVICRIIRKSSKSCDKDELVNYLFFIRMFLKQDNIISQEQTKKIIDWYMVADLAEELWIDLIGTRYNKVDIEGKIKGIEIVDLELLEIMLDDFVKHDLDFIMPKTKKLLLEKRKKKTIRSFYSKVNF
tara:strand:- start:14844 stop:15281 length:438 start_codon:yes stop_codon:yes gene_type:complete